MALIIDDLGYRKKEADRAIRLPGPVALAVLPNTPFGRQMALRAHRVGKEVLLHMPMQATEYQKDPGPSALLLHQSRIQFADTLRRSLASVPHAVGINNHMGSLLTRHPGAMAWLMEEIKGRPGFFFLDSFTTHRSVALQLAREASVPALKRDVFLDRKVSQSAMARELRRAKTLADKRGFAVIIGHPHAETLGFLESVLPDLPNEGYDLVRVTELLPEAWLQRSDDWQAYEVNVANRQ